MVHYMRDKNNRIQIFPDLSQSNNYCSLIITKAAIQQISKLMASDTKMLGLKIDIKISGCAGYSYVIEKVTALEKNTLTYEYNGVKIYIPTKIVKLIDGTEIDYVTEDLKCMFKFNNPQIRFSCGCGDSFNI